MPMAEPILAAEGLSIDYVGRRQGLFGPRLVFRAVREASFSVARGETFGLIGESGSGKSTIGRAILRLVPISGGSLRVVGLDLATIGRSAPLWFHKKVQVVFQDPLNSLNPRMLVGDAIAEAVARHRGLSGAEREKVVAALLSDVGLAAFQAKKYPIELSGGQQQRVAIARALATEPELIVCDEVVSALDVSTQSQIINLFEDLQDEHHLSYLFISHDLSVVRHISQRIAIIHKGEIVETNATEELFTNPSHWYTRELLASVPRLAV